MKPVSETGLLRAGMFDGFHSAESSPWGAVEAGWMPSPGGQVSRMEARAIPTTSRRAYRTATHGRSVARSDAVASRAAHGWPCGRSGDRSTGWHSVGAGERPPEYPRIPTAEAHDGAGVSGSRACESAQRTRGAGKYRKPAEVVDLVSAGSG
jgi:hypothetical protein